MYHIFNLLKGGLGFTGFWLTGNKGMEKNMESIILVYIKGLGLCRDYCKAPFIHSWLTEGQ